MALQLSTHPYMGGVGKRQHYLAGTPSSAASCSQFNYREGFVHVKLLNAAAALMNVDVFPK